MIVLKVLSIHIVSPLLFPLPLPFLLCVCFPFLSLQLKLQIMRKESDFWKMWETGELDFVYSILGIELIERETFVTTNCLSTSSAYLRVKPHWRALPRLAWRQRGPGWVLFESKRTSGFESVLLASPHGQLTVTVNLYNNWWLGKLPRFHDVGKNGDAKWRGYIIPAFYFGLGLQSPSCYHLGTYCTYINRVKPLRVYIIFNCN